MFNLIKLCQDHGLPYWTEGKNVTTGWVNTRCPFCGDRSNHLGMSPNSKFVCWRCGAHPFPRVIARLLQMDEASVYPILKRYGGEHRPPDLKEAPVRIGTRKFQYPSGTGPMTPQQKAYLARRNFDPEKLEAEWGLQGTGPVSALDHIDFRHRIIIPITWEGRVVSFQARDFTNKSTLRYVTCPKERELVHHKNILYGNPDKWGDTIIIVEGVTDVWRLGGRSCATFGISYKMEQVREISNRFKRVFILFDDEPQAQAQARKLSAELEFRKVDTEIIQITGDPGGMKDDDAQHLLKNLFCKIV